MSAASGDGLLGNEICMIFDGETGNALGCFDYTPEALEAEALEIRRARGEVTTVTYGPSPFIIDYGGNRGASRGRDSDCRTAAKLHDGVRNSQASGDSMVITQSAPRSANYRGRDTEGVTSMPAEDTPRLKYRVGMRALYTNRLGDRERATVVDASRDHVTVELYDGRRVRLEGSDIALRLSRSTRPVRRGPRW